MTGLGRTDLSTSHKAHLAASAFGQQGVYGAMTGLAEQYGVSRPTVYDAAKVGQAVLVEHFERAETDDSATWVGVDKAQLTRAIVALRVVAPNSLRAIETLLPILYPGVSMSYGSIQAVAVDAESRAAEHNALVDLSPVVGAALDEMYSQGEPVLAGVDLDSGHLCSLALRDTRGGDDWAEVLGQAKGQGLDLAVVVKDAARGIEVGVREVFPEAEQRDDCFHAKYEMTKVHRRLSQRAFAAIQREVEAERAHDRATRQLHGRFHKTARRLALARRRCREAIELHDAYERAMRLAWDSLDFVAIDTGTIQTEDGMRQQLQTAAEQMMAVEDVKARKAGVYLRNRAAGLALHMGLLRAQLDEIADHFGDQSTQLACVIWQLRWLLQRGCEPLQRLRHQRHLWGAYAMLRDAAGDNVGQVFEAVHLAAQNRYRASSAIEGFNAALRPFLYVHKGVSQGFLDLFRAYYNLRTRRWGRHKGTSSLELLTGRVVEDWLDVLGYPANSMT